MPANLFRLGQRASGLAKPEPIFKDLNVALADIQQLVMDLVPDQDVNLTPDVRSRAIEQAVLHYSSDLPRDDRVDMAWPVRGVFADAPDGWQADAGIRSATWRLGPDAPHPVFIVAYRKTTGDWGLESSIILPAGASVQLHRTVLHLLSDAEDTIPVAHRLPVAAWAACLLCRQLATRFSAERESMLGADMAQTESRARAYANRAKEWCAAYYLGLGLVDPQQRNVASDSATAVSVSWPKRNPRHSLVVRP